MITSSFKTGAGNLVLEFDVAHTSQAEVADLGTLNYNFDQTPDQLSIDRVQALYTYIHVDLLQYDDGGNDLWGILIEATNEATVRVAMALEVDSGAFEFFFRLRKSDISLNEEDGIVRVRLTPNTNLTTTMGGIFNSMYAQSVPNVRFNTKSLDEDGREQFYIFNCFAPKDFINSALNQIFDNSFGNLIRSASTDLGDDYSPDVFDEFTFGRRQLLMADVRTANPPSGTFQVGPGQPEDDTEPGIGMLSSLGLPSLITTVSIPAENNVDLGDVIYYADESVAYGGRKIGTVIAYLGGVLNQYEIERDEDDFVPLPFGSWPFKIARAKRPENFLIIDVLKDMAGVEGSVFGTGFSKNWYVNRLAEEDSESDNLVTLNYNEAIDFRPFNFDLSLGRSVVGQVAEYRAVGDDLFGQWGQKVPVLTNDENPQVGAGVPNIGSFTSVTSGNRGASKGLDIKIAPAYPFLCKGFSRSGGALGFQDSVLNDLSLESALTRSGLRSYFQSLNATKESIAVEFSILGATRVLPFNLFQFDSRAPEKYRDKQFRITEARYDFVNNLVKIKGYQISSITTPVVDDPRPFVPPPRTPPPFTGDPIGILIEGVNDEEVTQVKINLFHSVQTGKAMVILNDTERQQGYFQNFEAGQYEIVVDQVESEDVVIETGVKDVPIQLSRINAPAGSFVYKSAPFDDEEQRVTQNRVTAINVELTNVAGNASATANALFELNTTVSNINGVVTAQSFALLEINSAITGINETTNAQASAIFGLQTCVSTVGNTVTAQGSAITSINASIDGLESNVTATAFALDQTNVLVEAVDGKVTNISAKRAIVVGAGDKLAEISLSANDGDGSQGSSEINISADQVRIVGVVFEDANGIIRSEPFTPGAGGTGWRIDGDGNAEFHNLTVWGELITSSDQIINPPILTFAFGSVDMSGSGQTFIVEWGVGDTVVSTDTVEIRHFRNGTELGSSSANAITGSPNSKNYSGGSSSDDLYAVVTLVRGGNAVNSITTRNMPVLL